MTPSNLAITLFGEFSLTTADKKVVSFTGDRPITLLAYLLLHRNTPVARQHLAYTLWPDSTDNQARANLRNLFFTLRQTLPHADEFVAADSMTLQWRNDACFTLDVAEFETALSTAGRDGSVADNIIYLETAVSLYKGDLLPGNYDDWIVPLRESLRQSYLDALHQLIALLEQQQDYRAAVRYCQRLLQQDPLDESAYVQMMRLQAQNGDRAGVRRTFEQCVATLRRELDVEPSPSTLAAYEQLLRLEISLPAGPPAELPTLTGRYQPRPLPNLGNLFVGREAELAQIERMLANPACRLINIFGPGGMGKTRLALAVAAAHQAQYTDGVAFVPLATVNEPFQIVTAIAAALNFPFSGSSETRTQLFNYLGSKQMLLVLDNLEQFIPEIEVIYELLEAAGGIQLLVTCRERLNIQQEWLFPLDGLPLPADCDQPLPANSAVSLFLNSAAQQRPDFSPDEKELQAICRISELVGGSPLGLELAATWVRLLSCGEIAQELEKSLDFLTVNVRNMPKRHQSLRAVFDYSWNLLDTYEQQVLLRLAMFQGGFSRDAANQVAGANLQQLITLIDRSLVQVTSAGRYALHSIVHQFAGQLLQANPEMQHATTRRHSHYYLQWLIEMNRLLSSAGQKEALLAIVPELPNIRAAWKTALQNKDIELLCAASFPLFFAYELRGMVHEGEKVFRQAAETLESHDEANSRDFQLAICNFQTNRGFFMLRLGRNKAADQLLRRIVNQLKDLDDQTILPFSLRYLGLVAVTKGAIEEARQLMLESLALTRGDTQQWETAIAQAYLGLITYNQGHLDNALAYLEKALEKSRELSDYRLTAYSLLLLGRTHLALGQISTAEAELEESKAIAHQTNDMYTYVTVQLQLGMVKHAQGELNTARKMIRESIRAYLENDDLLNARRAQIAMGYVEISTGNLETARELFQSILPANEVDANQLDVGKKYIHAALLGLAIVSAAEQDSATAQNYLQTVLNDPGKDWQNEQQARKILAELSKDSLPLTIDMKRNVNHHNVPMLAEPQAEYVGSLVVQNLRAN